MTFGIDISTHQASLDIVAAKNAGAEFVLVKAVASYLPQLTVADDYHNNIDRVIAAGLGHAKGHYAVPNSRNTPEATAAFQVANVYRPAPTDAFMLDNEPLDTYKVYWRDDLAAAYFYKLHELGVRYEQMWFYCPAALTRASGPWPKIEALRKLGLKIVWVSYGDNDPIREAGEEPLLGGGITGWDVHQFTSTWRVPGYGGNVDGNYTPHSVATLFGGPVSLEDQMRQYIAANKKPSDAATWDQMCGSLMFRFNSWRGWVTSPYKDISSAYRVAMGSGWLNTDIMKAPVGAWHFFDIGGPGNGHVMQDARGGGLVCLSTGYALSESLGNAIGFQSVPGYVAAKGARYLGWATNYAGGTIDVSGLSGLGVKPIIEEEKDEDMTVLYQRKSDGRVHAINVHTGRDYHVPDEPHLALLRGHEIFNDGSAPTIVEDNIFEYIRSLAADARAAFATATVDVDALAAKVIAGIKIPAGSGVTEAQVEAAVRRVFADASS